MVNRTFQNTSLFELAVRQPNTNCILETLVGMMVTLCHSAIMPGLALMIKIMIVVLVIVPVRGVVAGGITTVPKESLLEIHTAAAHLHPVLMPSGPVSAAMHSAMYIWRLNHTEHNKKYMLRTVIKIGTIVKLYIYSCTITLYILYSY